jgi:Zn-finger nucleic acid-binding protein
VDECLECRSLELEIKNLEEGLRLGKLEAFTREYSSEEKDTKLEILIRLTDELENKRREYKQHRKTHFGIN